jgi:uncharacterized protein YeaO (DUF488 family)
MAFRVVRLGSPRVKNEGLRIGTVRRPPRGVPKARFAEGNWFDLWFPELAPSDEAFQVARAATTPQAWAKFVKRYRVEMSAPDKQRLLRLLAMFSAHTMFSVGCYCEDESRCHRSVLRALLEEAGASLA